MTCFTCRFVGWFPATGAGCGLYIPLLVRLLCVAVRDVLSAQNCRNLLTVSRIHRAQVTRLPLRAKPSEVPAECCPCSSLAHPYSRQGAKGSAGHELVRSTHAFGGHSQFSSKESVTDLSGARAALAAANICNRLATPPQVAHLSSLSYFRCLWLFTLSLFLV